MFRQFQKFTNSKSFLNGNGISLQFRAKFCSVNVLRNPKLNVIKTHSQLIPQFKNSTNLIQSSIRSYRHKSHYNYSHTTSQFSFIDRLSSDTIIYGILGTNLAIFLIIQFMLLEKNVYKRQKIELWLRQNVYLNLNNLKEGRIWTLITNGFAHQDFRHALMNFVTLYFFCAPVLASLGNKRFLALYFGSGLGAGALFLAYKKSPSIPSIYSDYVTTLGASGHTMGLLTYFALKYPFENIIFFVFPIPAIILVGGYVLYDLFSVGKNEKGIFGLRINHVGHLGGALVGLIGFLLTRRPGPGLRARNQLGWRGRI